MAISVTALLTNITLAESADDSNWTGGGAETDVFLQGSQSWGAKVSNTTGSVMKYDMGTAGTDLSNQHIYMWFLSLSNLDTTALGGFRIYAEDTSGNTSTWYVSGSDKYPGGWQPAVIDINATPDATSGTLVHTAIRYVGAQFKTLGKWTGGNSNTFIDALRYGSGLRITSGAADGVTFDDIFNEDDNTSNKYGVVTKQSGVYFVRGELIFGNTTSQNIDFSDAGQVVVFPDERVDIGLYKLKMEANATGTYNFQLGEKSGTSGINGCTIKCPGRVVTGSVTTANGAGTTLTDTAATFQTDHVQVGATVYNTTDGSRGRVTGITSETVLTLSGGLEGGTDNDFDASDAYEIITTEVAMDMQDTDLDALKLYGSTFDNMGQIDFLVDSADREALNCNFIKTKEILPDTMDMTNCNIISAKNRGVRIESASHSVTSTSFIDCLNATHIASNISPTYNDLTFSGNTYDIENSTANSITVTASGTSDPTTVNNTGGGSTTILSTVNVDVHVEDSAGTAIQNAQVYIQRATPTAHTAGAGNTAGNTTLVLTASIDTDQPSTGYVQVRDVSLNEVQGYRYQSYSGSTFTLRTEVTGSATSTGSSTSLVSTSTNFTTADIEEGDTIRNTTDTGAWAVIDEIVDADNITTTPLQGGTTNVWTSGDGFSVHRLATTLVSGTDTVDTPLSNSQTDASGDITTLAYDKTAAPTDVVIRVRSNQGATKYVPAKANATISATSGLSVSIAMQTDTEAS